MRRRDESGVALLTVLLLVAVMSALAVGVLDTIRFGLRRAANAETVGQAQWYALGAETLARERIARLNSLDPQRTSGAGGWNGAWRSFPIEHGVIRARVTEATSCFNLNSVVQGATEQYSRRDLGARQFTFLLQELGSPQREAEALTEALADWMDSDSRRTTQGAEDDVYANLPRPYRTSATLLGEVSELRAIRGFTPKLYARLRPLVCVLPTADLSPININMLGPDKAVLLSAVSEGKLQPEAARRLLAARPEAGWQDVNAFWSAPEFAGQLPSDEALDQLSVRTRFFGLEAHVDYAGGEAILTALFEQPISGPARLVARRWGYEE